jgi:hypothetical protein
MELNPRLPFPVPETKEAGMVRRPRTVGGYLFVLLFGVLGLAIAAEIVYVLVAGGPMLWGVGTVLVVGSAITYVSLHRLHAGQDAAVAGAPSFAGHVLRSSVEDGVRDLPV